MIKSNHGSGYVKNVEFQNFISRGTAYGLNVDQYWSSQSAGSGAGVELSNITFSVRLTMDTILIYDCLLTFRQYRTGTEMLLMA